jgi:hypothetical protein
VQWCGPEFDGLIVFDEVLYTYLLYSCFLWARVLKVYPVTFLTNALNQSMQVLKWLECLMFIPISQWLQNWGLLIVNLTDSWDFVVVRSFLSSRWSVFLFFLRQKATLLTSSKEN